MKKERDYIKIVIWAISIVAFGAIVFFVIIGKLTI